MYIAIMVGCLYLTIGIVCLCLRSYLRKGREKIRLKRMELDRQVKAALGDHTIHDRFYCIMREGGRTSGGYLPSDKE